MNPSLLQVKLSTKYIDKLSLHCYFIMPIEGVYKLAHYIEIAKPNNSSVDSIESILETVSLPDWSFYQQDNYYHYIFILHNDLSFTYEFITQVRKFLLDKDTSIGFSYYGASTELCSDEHYKFPLYILNLSKTIQKKELEIKPLIDDITDYLKTLRHMHQLLEK